MVHPDGSLDALALEARAALPAQLPAGGRRSATASSDASDDALPDEAEDAVLPALPAADAERSVDREPDVPAQDGSLQSALLVAEASAAEPCTPASGPSAERSSSAARVAEPWAWVGPGQPVLLTRLEVRPVEHSPGLESRLAH